MQDAIAWIAEEHPISHDANWSQLLRAIVLVAGSDDSADVAIRRVVREATRSEVDTAKVIFDHENIVHPSEYASALNELLARSCDGTLGSLTARDVLRAQSANPLCIETLCLAVGVTYSDAVDWYCPGSTPWSLGSVRELLEYLRVLVEGRLEAPYRSAVPARAIELLALGHSGWALVDQLRTEGVPYEVLLAQRAVGGAWLAHKNKTSNFPNSAAADALCSQLSNRCIDYRRASTVGGSSRQRDLQELAGIPKKQIGVVVVNSSGQATFAVAFSSARDGGTARANGDGLLQIPVTGVPLALMLTGLGWATRPETDRLARKFGGRLYTEQTIDDLVATIEEACS